MSDQSLDHEEALRRVDAQLGQRVFFGIIVRRGPGMDHDSGIVMVSGELNTDLMERPPRVARGVALYTVGIGMSGWDFLLPPMPGAIREHDSGLNFEVSKDVVIRVAWRPAPDKPPIGPEGVAFAADDSLSRRAADVPRDHELVLEDPTPTNYWAEIIEQRQVQDPDTGRFHSETTHDCHKVEWHGTALTAKHAQEAAMAAFEERFGYRPRPHFSAAYDHDPKLARIKGAPGGGRGAGERQ